MERLAYRICPLCEACCGLELGVRDDKIVSIRGHGADVFSAGFICPKGVALRELHEDPDRLRAHATEALRSSCEESRMAWLTPCVTNEEATAIALRIAFALEEPWQITQAPLTPSRGAPPYCA